jgi:multiple sugar transport system permease protein
MQSKVVHEPQLVAAKGRRDESERGLYSAIEARRPTARFQRGIGLVLLWTIAVITFFPLYWLIVGSMKTPLESVAIPPTLWPERMSWESFSTAWNELRYFRYFSNTVIIVCGDVILRVTVSALAAYSLAKLQVPFRKFFIALVLTVLMVPGIVYFVPKFLVINDLPLLHISLYDTWWAIWLAELAAPIPIYLLMQFFARIPDEITDAARLDGCGSWRVFTRIILPMSRPVIAVVVVITIISGWKEFLWPFLVLQNQEIIPIEVALLKFTGSNDTTVNVQMAAMTIATLPMIAIFLIFQRQILRGVVLSGGRG